MSRFKYLCRVDFNKNKLLSVNGFYQKTTLAQNFNVYITLHFLHTHALYLSGHFINYAIITIILTIPYPPCSLWCGDKIISLSGNLELIQDPGSWELQLGTEIPNFRGTKTTVSTCCPTVF